MNLLYSFVISPIELVIEVIFVIACRLFVHRGVAIIMVSLLINLLILPMYRHADALQEKERKQQKKMEPFIRHIRQTFSGNERFMMLQAYYRQQDYKPAYALRGSVSLLLQIPFFIAAYHFLSNLTALRGIPFLSVRDLGAPDGLLSIGGTRINLLPVLMTVINLLSAVIYLRSAVRREKLQVFLMALLFLVLLYNSPSGLVLYWTCNNIFSLFKNLIARMRHRREFICALIAVAGALLLLLMHAGVFPAKRTLRLLAYALVLTGIAAFVAVVLQGRKRDAEEKSLPSPDTSRDRQQWISFFPGCLLLTLLTGLVIPTALIAVSPADFTNPGHYVNPLLNYVPYTFCTAAGCFLLWAQILYYFSGARVKRAAAFLMPAASLLAFTNYTFFGNRYGIISAELHYNNGMNPAAADILFNLGVLAVLFSLILIISKKVPRIITSAVSILCLASFLLGIFHIYRAGQGLAGIGRMIAERKAHRPGDDTLFTLSSAGKNVVVIILDKAMGPWVPYIFEELPVLQEQFEGFCYYSNTLSQGAFTLFGSPGLYGGYEYTPANTAKRADMLLKDKHNEALMLMPLMFERGGFQVTVCDQPLGNYAFEEVSDLSMYDGHPEITAVYPQDSDVLNEERDGRTALDRRNFFCYGIMRSAPVLLHEILYWNGTYFSSNTDVASGYKFLREYAILENLPLFTDITDNPEDHFVTLYNQAPHEYVELQMPRYDSGSLPDNTAFNTSRREAKGHPPLTLSERQFLLYCTNAATYLRIGEWLDSLREAGVYDNTRIILVADHGANREEWYVTEGMDIDIGRYMPLLMVKDFDAKEFTSSSAFMTNADTPYLAMEGVLSDMRNPFTGVNISPAQKEPLQTVMSEGSMILDEYRPRTDFDVDGTRWYTVSGDISDPANWKKLAGFPGTD